jgi:hypothetical protein
MAKTTTISVRMDAELKNDAENILTLSLHEKSRKLVKKKLEEPHE